MVRLKSMHEVLAGIGILVALASCGAGGGTTVQAKAPSASGTTAKALRAVTYQSITLEVPAGWPVYDLVGDPKRCARFDVHAVYLGHQGPNASCPARALGKSEAVQVEADDLHARSQILPSPSTTMVNGQSIAYEPGSQASHSIVATYLKLGVVVTATYGLDQAQAQQIVDSVRKAGS